MSAVAAGRLHGRSPLPGTVLIAVVAAIAVLGPFLSPHDLAQQNLMNALASPALTHPLGTDHLGRDVLSRLLHGAPRSLGIAVICVAVASGIGIAIGMIAAWNGRALDAVIMRIADMTLAFPGILLALLLAGLMGGGIVPMLIGIKLSLWPQFARLARAVTTGVLMSEAHVEAARLAGFGPLTIAWRHVMPDVLRQTATLATLGIGAAVMSISALGFLGLGLQPPTPEWGAMISELLPYVTEAPVQIAAPCLLIFATVLGFTLAGETLSEQSLRRNAVA
ncbi:MAG: ABC transporter permease [Rhodospirillales bacterium]